MPRDDEVRVSYRVEGTEQGKQKVDSLNESISKTPESAQQSSTGIDALDKDLNSLDASIAEIEKELKKFEDSQNKAGESTEDLKGNVGGLTSRLVTLFGTFANPAFLAASAIFTAIASSVAKAREEAVKYAAEIEELAVKTEKANETVAKLREQRRDAAAESVPDLEESLIRGGLDPTQAGDVGLRAARATISSGIPIAEIVESASDLIVELRRLPTSDELIDIATTRRLSDTDATIAQILAAAPSLRNQLDTAISGQAGSVGGGIAREQVAEFLSGILEVSRVSPAIRDVETELSQVRETQINLQRNLAELRAAPTDVAGGRFLAGAGRLVSPTLNQETIDENRAFRDSFRIINKQLAERAEQEQFLVEQLETLNAIFQQMVRGDVQIGSTNVQNFNGPVTFGSRDTVNPSGASIAPNRRGINGN